MKTIAPAKAFRSARPAGGFTLLEVVLAIAITIGMLAVVLFFYRQAADLRVQVLREAEYVSAARLLMDRITAELRGARPLAFPRTSLHGQPHAIAFVTTVMPSPASWGGLEAGGLTLPETDLRRIRYGLSGTETNVTGLERAEEFMVERRDTATPEKAPEPTLTILELPEPPIEAEAETVESEPPPASDGSLLTDQVRFLRFRYWDGRTWWDDWNAFDLPLGVEVSLGREPLPADLLPGEYPHEMFRRVIYLPASSADPGTEDWAGDLFEPEMTAEETP